MRTNEPTNLDFNRLPPQALELERAVLGALLLESKAIKEIDMSPDDFYHEKNKVVFRAIESLISKRNPVDILTVYQELVSRGDGARVDAVYLSDLLDVASSAHIEYHAKIVKQKALARKLINFSNEAANRAYDETTDIQDTLEYLEHNFTAIRAGGASTSFLDMRGAISRTLDYLALIQNKRASGESVAIPTGLKQLDNQINGGWSSPDLIILGGRPSMGKTQFALHFAKTASANDKHCLFVSIEMTVEQLILRLLTEDDRLNLHAMKTGQMRQEEWGFIDEKIATIQNSKLLIADDYDVRYLQNIKSLARQLKRDGKLDLLIIDYLQLIKTNQRFGTRDLEVGFITGELKNLAKELDIPVILLAQLKRSPNGEKARIPALDDLRESGNIEQDADKVIFPHRPSYYNPDDVDVNGRSWQNRGLLIIGKNREGEKDKAVYFKTDDRFKKIFDDEPIIMTNRQVQANKQEKDLPF